MENVLYKDLTTVKDSINLQNKAGIYKLVNLDNGKTYIGSSNNLNRRLKEYLNPAYLKDSLLKGNSYIMTALLKYGTKNFGIIILEFIELNDELTNNKLELKKLLLSREQHYIDTLKPDYNINKTAGSNLGRVYSKEVRLKMSTSKLGKPGNKLGAKLSEESRKTITEKHGMSRGITMYDGEFNILAKFYSIQDATDKTGISRNRIGRCARGIRKQIIEKGKIYIFRYSDEKI